MMPTEWNFFPWPVLFVIPMIAMVALTAVRLSHHRGATGSGCRLVAPADATANVVTPPPVEDPVVVLRERFARGEIDLPEFETRLDDLLRTDPGESTSWQDLPTRSLPPRSTK